ncbi:hypothetical protein DBR06_SOUSAS43010006, partial [Sousa chinensis]
MRNLYKFLLLNKILIEIHPLVKIQLTKHQIPKSVCCIVKYIRLIDYFENGCHFHVNDKFLFHGLDYGTYLLQETCINIVFI